MIDSLEIKNVIINAYDFNLLYAKQLVSDLNQEQMTTSPSSGLENHPAFTIGHLVTGSALTYKYLGGEYEVKEGWDKLFRRNGPGDPTLPESDLILYPSKKELLEELETKHNLVKDKILKIKESELSKNVDWRYKNHLPKLKDLLNFMCVTHESMHLGQLAGWRRAMGLDSALAKL